MKQILRFSIFYFLFSLTIISAISAQVPSGIDPNNLSNVRIDELSDEQIMAILKQGEGAGVTIDQAEIFARKRGLPASEAAKFKDRVAKLQAQGRGATGNDGQTNPETEIAKKVEEEADKANATTGKIVDAGGNASGTKSTIYGQEYFRNGDIKIFDKSTDAKAPSNYIIGIGDELGISVFGFSYYNEVLKVDSRGAINPQQMGPVFVKGLSFEKAKALIRSKMSQYFDLSNNRLEITLAYSRSITVNIVGEVVKPGSYKIPALNTAFNALILAGGPNDIGTLRNIQIRRDGKVIRTLDVYEFLNNPNSKQDFYLEDNDYIIIPTINRLVRLSGEVNRATQFEIKSDEGLLDVIKYAGGLKEGAYKEKIQIVRRSNLESKIIELNLDSLMKIKKDFDLQNGDLITIKSTINEILNKVSIKGAVNFAGDFSLGKSERVYDLIMKSGGLKQDANLDNAYLVRTKQDQTKEYFRINLREVLANKNSEQNLILQTLDVMTVYSNKDYVEPLGIQVLGSVRKEGSYDYVNGMTLGDALQNAGGLKLEAENLRIEISRLSYFSPNYNDGQEVRVIIESIKLSSNNSFLNDEDAQIKLQPFDQIFVRRVPNFEVQQNITIRGEVKYPGVYTLMSKDEKIDDVIKRAGGINRFAFAEGATLFRPSLPGGFIVLKLNDVLKNEKSKYNFNLREGDVLTIPTITDFVGIRGSSIEYLSVLDKDQVNAPYVSGRRAKYYINEFGNGFTKESWRKKTYVIQPNSKINRTKNYILFKLYPKVTKGSTIYVVNKVKKEKEIKKEAEPFNWNKFIENTTVKLTGIATLFILLRQL